MRFLFGVATGLIMASAPKIIIESIPSHLLDYGFGAATNLFTFVSVAMYLAVGTMNSSSKEEKHGSTWIITFLIPIPLSMLALLGFFTIYKTDSPSYLIETGAPKEKVM